MKNPILRTRALERLYQKALRLQREDEVKFDVTDDSDFDYEARAKTFVASMSNPTQVLVATHVQERHGLDALDDFSWLMPPLAGCVFALQATLMRVPELSMVD